MTLPFALPPWLPWWVPIAVLVVVLRRIDAGRIDDAERPPAPFAQGVEPVARDAGRVFDDREPPADQAVEERALPDVGSADDGDGDRPEPDPVGGL